MDDVCKETLGFGGSLLEAPDNDGRIALIYAAQPVRLQTMKVRTTMSIPFIPILCIVLPQYFLPRQSDPDEELPLELCISTKTLMAAGAYLQGEGYDVMIAMMLTARYENLMTLQVRSQVNNSIKTTA